MIYVRQGACRGAVLAVCDRHADPAKSTCRLSACCVCKGNPALIRSSAVIRQQKTRCHKKFTICTQQISTLPLTVLIRCVIMCTEQRNREDPKGSEPSVPMLLTVGTIK